MGDFVTFDIAKKLKEKGFPIKTKTEGKWGLTELKEVNILPTISQVLKWLREEMDIHIEPCILASVDTDANDKVINEFTYWSFSIVSIVTGDMIYFEYKHIDDRRFDLYEQAALAGIKYALDNLI